MNNYDTMEHSGRMVTEQIPLGAIVGFGIVAFIFWAAIIAFSIVVGWKLFVKAGKPGWKCIIPVYNIFIFLQIVNRPWWWIFLFFIPLVNLVMMVIVYHDLSKAFGKDGAFTVGLVLINIVFLAILAFDKSVYTYPLRATDTPSQPQTPIAPAQV